MYMWTKKTHTVCWNALPFSYIPLVRALGFARICCGNTGAISLLYLSARPSNLATHPPTHPRPVTYPSFSTTPPPPPKPHDASEIKVGLLCHAMPTTTMRKFSRVCLLLAASAAVPASAFVAPLRLPATATQTARTQQRWAEGARSATVW